MAAVLAGAAQAAPLVEPPTYFGKNGVLDLLIIAEESPITTVEVGDPAPKGWIYTVCPRPAGKTTTCPADANTTRAFGGPRLALQPGDTLKIRFVNRLPAVDGAALTRGRDNPLLALNPSNLHTHGLVVNATANTAVPPAIPVYGDFVFTSVFNPANGNPATVDAGAYDMMHAHGDVVAGGVVDYVIPIAKNHPSGSFWFHPHVHGMTLNQLSAGLAGIITVGKAGDYACADAKCAYPVPETSVRHLVLKDTQFLGNRSLNVQPDPGFCADQTTATPTLQGYCEGDATAYPGGKWFHSVNGQPFPTIRVGSPEGEIWRLTNASGNIAYDLQLIDDQTGRPMAFQIVSLDGVSVSYPTGATAGQVIEVGRNRMRLAECGKSTMPSSGSTYYFGFKQAYRSAPVCATELVMMPASRVEIHGAFRDSSNALSGAPAGRTATLRQIGLSTGPGGDTWPRVDLAKIVFAPGKPSIVTEAVHIRAAADAAWTYVPGGVFNSKVPGATAAPLPEGCAPLAPGHRRRLYFANPNVAGGAGAGQDVEGNAIFGLGYEEIDENGVPVPGTFFDVTRFDPANQVCLPLASGQMPVKEVWELWNLSTELHNFHIHQTKFRKIDPKATATTNPLSRRAPQPGIAEDTVPLPFAVPGPGSQPTNDPDAVSCTVDDAKSGRCAVTPIYVEIPFARIGTFVAHCHVLEHEDGGMMGTVRVVPAAN